MAPLPDNNTACVWVGYNDGYNDHELQVRYRPPAVAADAITTVVGFFEVLAPLLYLITITGVRYRAAGSTVSLPNVWPGAATYGAFLMPENQAPRQLNFVGRDTGGRMVRWALFGFNGNTPGSYRINAADLEEIGEAIAYLDEQSDAGVWSTIGGLVPTIYPYANVNYNSYWETEARG